MYKRIEFIPGSFIAGNILSRLKLCDRKTIISLFNKGQLRNSQKAVSNFSLLANCLDVYAEITNSSLRYFFFGEEEKWKLPTYTEYDEFVLSYLDFCTEKELEDLFDVIQKLFPNAFYHSVGDYDNFRVRTSALINRLPWGALRNIPMDDAEKQDFVLPSYKKVSDLLLPELQRFIRGHRCCHFAFQIDLMPDIATYIGVSLHWIFDLKGALFCRYPIGDQIFDYYTIMQPEEQKMFVNFLAGCLKFRMHKISQMLNGVNL